MPNLMPVPFEVGQPIAVRKLDYATGHVLLSWSGTVLEVGDDLLAVRALFLPLSSNPVAVDGVPFVAGDVFTEYYFVGRWYNVFHIGDADGRRKGWYCNVTRPPDLDDEGVAFVDMALDLFVHPDGHFTVLDEDEFAVASSQFYAPEDTACALEAIKALVELATAGRLPAP